MTLKCVLIAASAMFALVQSACAENVSSTNVAQAFAGSKDNMLVARDAILGKTFKDTVPVMMIMDETNTIFVDKQFTISCFATPESKPVLMTLGKGAPAVISGPITYVNGAMGNYTISLQPCQIAAP